MSVLAAAPLSIRTKPRISPLQLMVVLLSCADVLCTLSDDEVLALPLLDMSTVKYVGGFQFKTDGFGESSVGFSQGPITLGDKGESIFIVGHATCGGGICASRQAIGEFAIPELSTAESVGLFRRAENIQPFRGFIDRTPTGNTYGLNTIGGMELVDDQLFVSVFDDMAQTPPVYLHNLLVVNDAHDLSASSIGGYHNMRPTDPDGVKVSHASRWFSTVPESHRQFVHGTHIGGASSGVGNIWQWPRGPSAYSFNFSTSDYGILNSTSIPSTAQLQDYEDNFAVGMNEGDDLSAYRFNTNLNNSIWTERSRAAYGFIVPRTRTYAVLGYSAGHEYGFTGSSLNNASDEYHYYWLFDMQDWKDVRDRNAFARLVKPYDQGRFDVMPDVNGPSDFNEIIGATYDPDRDRLYVHAERGGTTQDGGSRLPVILAFSGFAPPEPEPTMPAPEPEPPVSTLMPAPVSTLIPSPEPAPVSTLIPSPVSTLMPTLMPTPEPTPEPTPVPAPVRIQATPPASDPSPSSDSGALIGGIIGGVCVAIFCCGAAYWKVYRPKWTKLVNKKEAQSSVEVSIQATRGGTATTPSASQPEGQGPTASNDTKSDTSTAQRTSAAGASVESPGMTVNKNHKSDGNIDHDVDTSKGGTSATSGESDTYFSKASKRKKRLDGDSVARDHEFAGVDGVNDNAPHDAASAKDSTGEGIGASEDESEGSVSCGYVYSASDHIAFVSLSNAIVEGDESSARRREGDSEGDIASESDSESFDLGDVDLASVASDESASDDDSDHEDPVHVEAPVTGGKGEKKSLDPSAPSKKKPKKYDNRVRKCRECKIRIRGELEYMTHMKDVHNKVPSFKCPYCDEMFMRLFNQKVHIATHMNQRKHPCLLCGDEFTQKSNLKRHMQRKHEKPMKCPKCEARFAKPEECEVHFGVAHPGLKWSRFKIRVARSTAKKHQCYCKAKFTSKEDFANHRAQCSVADEFEKHRLMQKQEAVVGDNDDEMKEEAALSPVATSSPRRQVAVSGDASIAPSTSSHSPPSKRPQHSLPSLHSGHSLSSQHSGHSLPSLHSGHSLPPLHSGHPDSNAARHPDPSIDATASSQGSIGLGDLMKHHGAPSTAAAAGGVLAQQQHPPGVALPDPPAYTEEPVTDSSAVQNPLTFEDREALEFVKKVLPGMRMKAAMGQAPLLPSSIHGPLSGLDITSLQISSGSSPAAATDLPPAQFSPPAAIPLDLSFPPMSNTGNLATFPSSSASLALPSLPPLGATDLGDIGGNFAHSPTDLPPLVQRQASLSLSAGAGGVAGAASLPPSSMPFLAPQISSGALASDSLVDRSRPPLVLQHSGTFPAIGLMSLDSVDSMHDAFGSSAAVSAMTIAPSTKLTHSRNSSISLSIQSAHSDSAVAASINAASTSMLMEDATERMLLQGQALGPHDHPQEKGLVEEESAGDLYSF